MSINSSHKDNDMALVKTDRDKAVCVLLREKIPASEVKEHCERTQGLENFKLSRIYQLKRDIEANQLDETVTDLANLPLEVVTQVVEEAQQKIIISDSPTKGVVLAELDDVLDGKKGLEKLNLAFQDTVTQALRVFNRHLADDALPLKDVKMIMDTVAKAHTDIFSSTTNIHIGDNNSDNKQLSVFQNTMRN